MGEDEAARAATAAARVRIEGRVQRVGYRYWTEGRAAELGLAGWVRNLTDGAVEAVFIGDAAAVARMLTMLEDGPTPAEVARVDAKRLEGAPLDAARRAAGGRFHRGATADPGAPDPI